MSTRLDNVLRDLERHKTIFDLDRDGLGEALMDVDARVILKNMDRQEDFDGNPWPPLSEGYGLWKNATYPGKPMAVLLGHMKTEEQVKGMRRVTARDATMVFGVDELARDEATWFQEGSADQPPRRFYGQSAEANQLKDELLQKHLEDRI